MGVRRPGIAGLAIGNRRVPWQRVAIDADVPPVATSTALLLLIHAMFADYTPEARLMDGRIPVLNVLREERAVAWLRANLPNAESFVCKGHMHFWAEPEVFNAALDAFLRKVA